MLSISGCYADDMHLTRLRIIAATAAVAALALTGCSSASPSFVGKWGDESQADQPSLELSKDGKVTGTDGCNRLMGSYTEEGDTIQFGQIASTMMFCEGVDTWLLKASTATVEGDILTINDENGAQIGTLGRAAE